MGNHGTDTFTSTDNAGSVDVSTFDNDPNLENTHRAMAEAGVPVETPQIMDFWSFTEEHTFYLPGQENIPEQYKQYIKFEKMNEGQKSKFQRETDRDIRIQSTTKDIKMHMDAASDRHSLLRISVTGWRMFRRNFKGEMVEYKFDEKSWSEWLNGANPKIIQDLEKAIRDANPWMKGEMTVEEIDAAIEDLTKQREDVVKENATK